MSDAYDMIDRFLRNNLGDDDYAEFSAALDSLCVATPQQAEAVQWREAIKNLADQYASECVEFAEAIKSGAGSMSPMAARAGDTRLALHNAIDCASPAPQQAEAVPSDVVRDAERYRWLRNESWAGYNTGKGTPSVYTVDGAGNRRMMLAEEAMDEAIDTAMAQGANHG